MQRKGIPRIFSKSTSEKVPVYAHPVLGELRLNEDGDCWEVAVESHGDPFRFAIGGDHAPDPALVQHALDILGNYPDFKHMLKNFLRAEIKRFADDTLTAEIKALRLEQVSLCHPESPESGMIFFEGTDEYRLWRCDYINRKPKGLGFDS